MPITAFNGVFEEKLKKIKKRLKEHLAQSKNRRDKRYIKGLLQEAKALRTLLKSVKKKTKTCPHCGGLIELDMEEPDDADVTGHRTEAA